MGQNTLIISKPSTGSGDDSALYPLKSHRNQKKIDASNHCYSQALENGIG